MGDDKDGNRMLRHGADFRRQTGPQAVLATATVRVAERAFIISSLLTEAGVISKARVAELVAMLAAHRDDSGVHPVTHVVFERLRDGALVSKRYEIERLLRVIGTPPA